MSVAEEHVRLAAQEGIPLVCAGEIGFTMGGSRWTKVCDRWFYEGLDARICHGCNVLLIAERESGMRREAFAKLWRGVVKDIMRVAKCVRVKVIGG